MGIPAFFRQIVEKYPNTHSPSIDDKFDYFFIDFNSIIYDMYARIMRDTQINGSNTQFENFLINEVIKKTIELTVDVVRPQKLLYIALDGSAPRAKMIQQRWRRYKHYKDNEHLDELRNKYGVPKPGISWDTSSHIAPGTKFMKKLSIALKKAIDSGKLSKHQKKLHIILSDSSVPGEGEHKFLPIIRNMIRGEEKDDVVCVYSPDADMIVLSMATLKNNIYILRKVKSGDDATDVEKEYASNAFNYLFLSIDKYTSAFVEKLGIEGAKKEHVRIITDYVFLTFLGGNDFVLPIPYLKIRDEKKAGSNTGGLGILMNIYRQLLGNEKDYLIDIKNGKYIVNMMFFTHIFENIAKSEDYYMRGIQMNIDKVKEGQGDDRKLEKEEGKTLYERDKIRYDHYEYYSKLHPQFDKYKPIFEKFDFGKPKHIWKPIYYEHFFGIKPNILPEYNIFRTKICKNYLESLIFTLKYYFEGIPSWSWYYQFRAPPTASDLLTNLSKFNKDINDTLFQLDEPFKPFTQLMMILPPQMGNLLPKSYHNLMKNELLQYYPIGFELDVVMGGKHIYSEPVLPYINEHHLLKEIEKVDKTLTKEENERNTITFEPYERKDTIKLKIKSDKKSVNKKTVKKI